MVLEHELQQLPLPRVVLAADGPDPADVADVVPVVGGVVHQHQVAVLERRGVAEIVHVVDVFGAGRRDRSVRFEPRAVEQEHIPRGGVELILGDARLGAPHSLDQAEARELRCAPNQRDFPRALDRAQLVEDRIEIPDLGARMARAQQLDEAPLPGRAAVPIVQRPRGFRRHQLAPALTGRFGGREFRVYDLRGPAIGWANALPLASRRARAPRRRRSGASPARHRPPTALCLRRARAARCAAAGTASLFAYVRRAPGTPRRLDAAQVVERVVLTRKRVPVGQRHALDDRHGAVADPLEELRPPPLELLGREVRLIVLRAAGCAASATSRTDISNRRMRRISMQASPPSPRLRRSAEASAKAEGLRYGRRVNGPASISSQVLGSRTSDAGSASAAIVNVERP